MKSTNRIHNNEHKHINIDEMISELLTEYRRMNSFPNVAYVNKVIEHCEKKNKRLMQIVNYYKIGKHGKIEELTDFDRKNIDRFPDETVFYEEFPEEAIKLDI